MVETRRSASANKRPLSSPQNSSSTGSKRSKVVEGNSPDKVDVGAKPVLISRDFRLGSSDRRSSDVEKAADACKVEKSPQLSDDLLRNVRDTVNTWQKLLKSNMPGKDEEG